MIGKLTLKYPKMEDTPESPRKRAKPGNSAREHGHLGGLLAGKIGSNKYVVDYAEGSYARMKNLLQRSKMNMNSGDEPECGPRKRIEEARREDERTEDYISETDGMRQAQLAFAGSLARKVLFESQ